MADTAQLNRYHILARRIGYSVGLELLLERSSMLADLYVDEKKLTYADWHQLVCESFGRKESALTHMADFYSQIKLIRLVNKEVYIQETLDILSIIHRYFDDKKQYNKAAQVVLLKNIIDADGDIFLNALSAEFEEKGFRSNLEKAFTHKRKVLTKVFPSLAIQKLIFDIVTVKNISSGSQKKQQPFADHFNFGNQSAFAKPEVKMSISDDYPTKVLPTRKGWAKDFDLYDDKGLTTIGNKLIDKFSCMKICNNEFCYLWPYKSEFSSIRIDSSSVDDTVFRGHEITHSIIESYGRGLTVDFNCNNSYGKIADLLQEIFSLYKTANRERASLRLQLPISLALLACSSILYAKKEKQPPLHLVLDKLTKTKDSPISFVNLRGTEGAITFKEII